MSIYDLRNFVVHTFQALGILLITLGLSLTPLAGCRIANSQDVSTQGGTAAVVTLTWADNGKSIKVHSGDSLVVRLDENPTTGFQWATDGHDDDILVLQSSDYLPAAGAVIGGGGQRIFTFEAQKAGTTLLQLKRWRAWEGDKSILERFAVTIRVLH
jgi:inhibitor of cysteine peptidase